MALPESIKTVEVNGYTAVSGMAEGHRFPIKLAPDEVMILKQLEYWWYSTYAAGANVMQLGLWRKSDDNPPVGIWETGEAQSMIWHRLTNTMFAAGTTVRQGDADTIRFPDPVILVRAPRFILQSLTMASIAWSMRLRYELHEASDRELAELMVKHHH